MRATLPAQLEKRMAKIKQTLSPAQRNSATLAKQIKKAETINARKDARGEANGAELRAKAGTYRPRKQGKLAYYATVFEANGMDRAAARQWAKDEGHSVGSVMQMYAAWEKLHAL